MILDFWTLNRRSNGWFRKSIFTASDGGKLTPLFSPGFGNVIPADTTGSLNEFSHFICDCGFCPVHKFPDTQLSNLHKIQHARMNERHVKLKHDMLGIESPFWFSNEKTTPKPVFSGLCPKNEYPSFFRPFSVMYFHVPAYTVPPRHRPPCGIDGRCLAIPFRARPVHVSVDSVLPNPGAGKSICTTRASLSSVRIFSASCSR